MFDVNEVREFYNTIPPEEREQFEGMLYTSFQRTQFSEEAIREGAVARLSHFAYAYLGDKNPMASMEEIWEEAKERMGKAREALSGLLGEMVDLLVNNYPDQAAQILLELGKAEFEAKDFEYIKSPKGHAQFIVGTWTIDYDISHKTLTFFH